MKKIGAFFLTAILFFLSAAVFAQEILDVSFDKLKAEERISIKLSKPLDPWAFFLKNPDRLVVDIKNALWDGGLQQINVDSMNITSIRWAQNTSNPPNFRLVVDLKRTIEKKVYSSADGKTIYVSIFSKTPEKSIDDNKITIMAKSIQTMEEKNAYVSNLDTKRETQKETKEIESIYQMPQEIFSSTFTKEVPVIEKPMIEGFSSKGSFSVFVNGKKFKVPKKVVWMQGRIMLPAKEYFDLLGFDFSFDKQSKVSRFVKGDEIEVKLKTDSDEIFVNGFKKRLPVPAVLVKGILHIPFISLSNNIGLQVYWNNISRTFYVGNAIEDIFLLEEDSQPVISIKSLWPVASFEARFDEKTDLYEITFPNLILNTNEKYILVKKSDIDYIKAFQEGNAVKLKIALMAPLPLRIYPFEDKIKISFPAVIKNISFTEEADSIKFTISSNKNINFTLKRFDDPDRIVIDFENVIYQAKGYLEVNKYGVLRIRASQFKEEPPTSRVVIDTEQPLPFSYSLSEDKKQLYLYVEKQKKSLPKQETVKALVGKVIVIDPGHGGHDSGAIGLSGEHIKEKDLNLSTALKLAKLLSDAGAIPLLTRDSDVFVSLQDRVDFTKRNNPDMFISIHFNLSEKSGISGTETYYYNENSKLLAQIIHNNLTYNLKRKDGGVRKMKFFVVYKNSVPSVLVEPLYLSDQYEEAIATDTQWQSYIAKVLFVAIKQYFELLR